MATPTAEAVKASFYAAVGDSPGQETIVLQKTVSSTNYTANCKERIEKKYSAGAADQQVDLSSFCTTLKILTIEDRGGTGVRVGFGGSANKVAIEPSGAMQLHWDDGQTPPTLYITNPSGSDAAYVVIGIIGSYS